MAFGFNNSQNRNTAMQQPVRQNMQQPTHQNARQMQQPSRQNAQYGMQMQQNMRPSTRNPQQPAQQQTRQYPQQTRQNTQQSVRQNPQPMQQSMQQLARYPQQVRQSTQQTARQNPQPIRQNMQQPTQQNPQPMRQNMQQQVQQNQQQSRQSIQQPMQQNPQQRPPETGKLPDGVTYQPLDARTIEEIKRIAPDHPGFAAINDQQPQQGNAHAEQTQASGRGVMPGGPPVFPPPAMPGANGFPITPALPQTMPLDHNGTITAPSVPVFPPIAEPSLPVEGYMVEGLQKLMQDERNGAIYYSNLAELAETSAQATALRGISESCRERGRAYNNLYRKHKSVDFETSDNPIIGMRNFHQGVFQAVAEENRTVRELIRVYENTHENEMRHVLSAQIYKKISDLSFLHQMILEKY